MFCPIESGWNYFPNNRNSSLFMASLGKRLDFDVNVVNQGITMLGNRNSTEQDSYIQQLRDCSNNLFVTFIEVLGDRDGYSIDAELNTSGDYLDVLFQGRCEAHCENGRKSITVTVRVVTPFGVGVLLRR